MGNQTKLKQALENIIDAKNRKKQPTVFKDIKTLHLKEGLTDRTPKAPTKSKQSTAEEKPGSAYVFATTKSHKPKAIEGMDEEVRLTKLLKTKKPVETNPAGPKIFHKKVLKKHDPAGTSKQEKNIQKNPTKTVDQRKDVLNMVAAKKIQMITRSGVNPGVASSPLQMHLVQSESLRIAQDKIADLEEELSELRQKNESVVSASEVLKDKNDLLKSQLEDIKYNLKEEKHNAKDEKEVLLSALEEAKVQINKFKNKTQELEKRLSSDLHGIRNRESSLESRIEILKMENSVLQREKDKKIIELKKQIQKIKSNLDGAHRKNHDLQTLNNQLQESSRRTVSALRATIYSLEGVKTKEETIVTEIGSETSDDNKN